MLMACQGIAKVSRLYPLVSLVPFVRFYMIIHLYKLPCICQDHILVTNERSASNANIQMHAACLTFMPAIRVHVLSQTNN